MSFSAIAAGVAGLVSAGVSAYSAYDQGKKADELLDQERPEAKIPESQKRALATQTYLAGTDAPGMAAAQDEAKQQAARQYEQGLDVAQSGTQAQGMLSQQGANLSSANRSAQQQNQQWKGQQMQGLAQQQGAMADAEWAVQQQNVMEPYYMDQARGQALEGASQANMNNALGGLASTGMSMAYMDSMGMMDGKKKTTTPNVAAASAGGAMGGSGGYQPYGTTYQQPGQQMGQQYNTNQGFGAGSYGQMSQSPWQTPGSYAAGLGQYQNPYN
jgi:hypothetical protein